ncbi:hypothetical protein CYY_000467 [Polysphondylium violaceum]|uniref:COMM domain-containing protein n=1 Tax=Polysphondylium violaceum TaxID=133409 RepID=A0A8J4Q3U7_9MYCE|nr:hypothetical protein CYY_000467 [Polysphondylium violaceum]
MASNNIFGSTKKFNDALEILNRVDNARFQKILVRIVNKIGRKGETIFTKQEEEMLENLLDLSGSEFKAMIQCCSFIFEQTAYYSLSSTNLFNQLENTQLDSEKCKSIQNVWEENYSDVLDFLRTKSISPLELDDVGWRLHYQMSSSTTNKRQASAIFEFSFKSDNNNNNDDENNDKMILEFNKEQLTNFFYKLETIQEKLDTLS